MAKEYPATKAQSHQESQRKNISETLRLGVFVAIKKR